MPSPRKPSCAIEYRFYRNPAPARLILNLFPREKSKDQQIRRLELCDRDISQVLIALHHVAADHRSQLGHGNPEFFGGFRLRVLRFPRSRQLQNTDPRFSTICIVGLAYGSTQSGRALIYATVPPKVRMY